jgi:hypothetical protein
MADIRGIPMGPYFSQGRLIAKAGVPAGFTVGRRYWPLCLVRDETTPAYLIGTADDNGNLALVNATLFSFTIDNLAP